MSGALIQLVSKGVQDVYLMTDEGHSFFRIKFTRHTNFSQAPKYLKSINDTDNTITIPVLGDIINGIWCERERCIIQSFLQFHGQISLSVVKR